MTNRVRRAAALAAAMAADRAARIVALLAGPGTESAAAFTAALAGRPREERLEALAAAFASVAPPPEAPASLPPLVRRLARELSDGATHLK